MIRSTLKVAPSKGAMSRSMPLANASEQGHPRTRIDNPEIGPEENVGMVNFPVASTQELRAPPPPRPASPVDIVIRDDMPLRLPGPNTLANVVLTQRPPSEMSARGSEAVSALDHREVRKSELKHYLNDAQRDALEYLKEKVSEMQLGVIRMTDAFAPGIEAAARDNRRLEKEIARLQILLGEAEQKNENLSKSLGDSMVDKRRMTEMRKELNSNNQQLEDIQKEAQKIATKLVQEQKACQAACDASRLLQQELEKSQAECDQLKAEKTKLSDQIKFLKYSLKDSNLVCRNAQDEVEQAKRIVDGQPYLLQCRFGNNSYATLTQIWHHAEIFADLPRSIASAHKYYQELNDPEREVLQAFWAQFQETRRLDLLPDKLKQIGELLNLIKPTIEAIFMTLWPEEDIPTNFFDLAIRLQHAPPRILEWKSSKVREGAL
ncbi:hypothetical protein D1007_62003 [Hordeum vulgare]|nr:hypothetical protein D1007_62003 [Hordeum vulgare]